MRIVITLFLALALPLIQGCSSVSALGAGAGNVILNDRRTTGFAVEDESIEWKVRDIVNKRFGEAHINVTSYNLHVLLTGEVSDEKMRQAVADAVRAIPNVKNVSNEMVIGANSSLVSRGNDTLITTNVKARLVGNDKVSPNHIKVVTENNVVYLMGIVSHAEGDAAAEVARTTKGVLRVVKIFEYTDSPSRT